MIHIIDIDTTIANNLSRASLLQKTCKTCLGPVPPSHRQLCPNCGSAESSIDQSSWDMFLRPELVEMDTPEPEAQRVIRSFQKFGVAHHYLTGRNEGLREITETWLATHFGYDRDHNKLIMRPTNSEGVSASAYKEDAFLTLRKDLGEDSSYVFYEDDPHVFTMYEQYGMVLKCPEAWEFVMPFGKSRRNEPAWNV